MKNFYLCILFLSFGFISFCQVADGDTTEIYVANKTNRFVSIQNNGKTKHSFFYRDLKSIRVIRELQFKTTEDVTKFFELCYKALELDKSIITKEYNLSRNNLNKNVVRLNNKVGGYTLIKHQTLELMREAFEKSIK